jgi:catechol 2,3-dioxygenase-like lactoylglutathione lyase family enzyme
MRGRGVKRGSEPSKRSDWWGVVLGAPDPQLLGRFYSQLLEWKIVKNEPGWTSIYPEEGVAYIAIQREENHIPPAWPEAEGKQQMMMHLDIEVEDLPAAVEHAIELGATVADFQPQDNVRVMLDPAGHPFCLYS